MAKKKAARKPRGAAAVKVTEDASANGTKEKSGSQHVRDHLDAFGIKSKPKDIITALAAKGITVNSGLIGNVKSKYGKGKKRGPKPGSKKNKIKTMGHESNGDTLGHALSLIESAGSVAKAQELLARLGNLPR